MQERAGNVKSFVGGSREEENSSWKYARQMVNFLRQILFYLTSVTRHPPDVQTAVMEWAAYGGKERRVKRSQLIIIT